MELYCKKNTAIPTVANFVIVFNRRYDLDEMTERHCSVAVTKSPLSQRLLRGADFLKQPLLTCTLLIGKGSR
jgi:hypothetical protein